MAKPPRKHSKPEDIAIKWVDNYKPTPTDLASMEELRRQVFKHAGNAGVQYDALLGGTTNFSTYSVKGTKPMAMLVKKELGLTNMTYEKRFFLANPKTVLGCIADNVSLEGIIKHEAGHMRTQNLYVRSKLMDTAQIMHDLNRLSTFIASEPEKAEASICEQFGSMEKFNRAVSHIEARTLPVIEALEGHAELFHASPEKLAMLRENNDPAYLRLEQTLAKLPGSKELGIFAERMAKALPPLKLSNAFSGANESPAQKMPHQRWQWLGNKPRGNALSAFALAFTISEEYAVDSFAAKNSADPNSVSDYLKWFSAKIAQTKGLPVSRVMATADMNHPPSEKRIKRMEHITTHGMAPDESVLNPPDIHQISISGETLSPIRESLHSPATKETPVHAPGVFPDMPKRSR